MNAAELAKLIMNDQLKVDLSCKNFRLANPIIPLILIKLKINGCESLEKVYRQVFPSQQLWLLIAKQDNGNSNGIGADFPHESIGSQPG